MSTALDLVGIHKSFDGFIALSDAQFDVNWGEVHALLGENGAGKSTLMNVAVGLYAPEAGTISIDGHPVRLSGPRDAARSGIGMVHQHFKLVSRFTVAENILLGMPMNGARLAYRKRLAKVREAIRSQCAALGFEIDPDRRVSQLSVAEQQRVEILKVLLAGARILVLDEPTAVLTDQEAARLLETMRLLASKGSAVVLVTHKMADVRRYADRVTVMRAGRTVDTFKPSDMSEAEMVRLAVGETVAAEKPSNTAVMGDRAAPRLRLRGVRSAASQSGTRQGLPALDGVDLTVHAGEIYGLAGVGGNGQSELMQAIMGLLPLDDGSMLIEGAGDLRRASAVDRREMGIACIPADRQTFALAPLLSVVENFAIGQVHAGRYGNPLWLDYRRMEEDAAEAVKHFDVLGVRSLRQRVSLLSGGNAQKLVIAREFARRPGVVLAHSPSRGLDARASAQVHARLRAARDEGAAVLVISEDLDEVLALADRAGVMVRGRIVGNFSAPVDRQAIGQAMVAHS